MLSLVWCSIIYPDRPWENYIQQLTDYYLLLFSPRGLQSAVTTHKRCFYLIPKKETSANPFDDKYTYLLRNKNVTLACSELHIHAQFALYQISIL